MKKRSLAALLAVLAMAAQAGEPVAASHIESLLDIAKDRPAAELMAPWIERDRQEQARGRVLNEMEAGTFAFLSGHFAAAEALFGDAQERIETIYADNPTAAAARSKFVPESDKEFKGDPYERAMVGYYLGLVDLARGDFDNARAGFRFAMLQDTMSASETYQDDMALMQYLVGWTYWCEGDRGSASEEFKRAQSVRGSLRPPQEGDNLLLLAEIGNAPQKLRDGKYQELLRYQPGPVSTERQVAFAVSGRQLTATLAEDLYFQASTRGGAAVDSIRAGKASFRAGAENIAGAAAGIGKVALGASLLSNGRSSRELLAISAVAGLTSFVSDSIARSTETAADNRTWTSLPATIHVASARANKADTLVAGFFGSDGRLQYAQPMMMRRALRGQCTLAFTRASGASVQRQLANAVAWQNLPKLVAATEVEAQHDDETDQAVSEQGKELLDMVRMMRESPGASMTSPKIE